MQFSRRRFSVFTVILLVANVLLIFYNTMFWHHLGNVLILDRSNFAVYLSTYVFYLLVLSLVFLLFSFPYIFKLFLYISILTAAFVLYMYQAYGVIVDEVMVQNILQTNTQESLALLNWDMVIFYGLYAVIPCIVIYYIPVEYPNLTWGLLKRVLYFGAVLAIIVLNLVGFYSYYASMFREHKELHKMINPSGMFYAVFKNMEHTELKRDEPLVLLDEQPQLHKKDQAPLFVLVVGETARADHFQLNGYGQATNPELMARKEELVNFPQVTSCGTSTAVSVPCMFSRLGRAEYSEKAANRQQNLLDLLSLAGVRVTWVDNNSDCKGVCKRIPTEGLDILQKEFACANEGCLDEVLVAKLAQLVEKSPANEPTVIVLHMMGSHGPKYYQRYPSTFSRFQPECKEVVLSKCEQSSIVNAYDNTIAYTDHVLNQLMHVLEKTPAERPTMLLYVSDHGESLGENGMYLHAAPYFLAPASQTHVPMLFWGNSGLQNSGVEMACAQEMSSSRAFSHDYLFDTVLGLMGVESRVYQKDLDMFASCRTKNGG